MATRFLMVLVYILVEVQKSDMAKFIESCPNCFMVKGYSVSLDQQDNGNWKCGKCGSVFVKDAESYMKKA